jgi:hypothetical protein
MTHISVDSEERKAKHAPLVASWNLSKIYFNDEATFHLMSMRVNKFHTVTSDKVLCWTINNIIYCDMLEFWLISKLLEHKAHTVFQKYGMPFPFHNEGISLLNVRLPDHWISQGRPIPSCCILPINLLCRDTLRKKFLTHKLWTL